MAFDYKKDGWGTDAAGNSLNPYDPTSGEYWSGEAPRGKRSRDERLRDESVHAWKNLQVPDQANLTYGPNGDVIPYDVGTPQTAEQTDWLTPGNAAAQGLASGSTFKGRSGPGSSSFAGLDPSAYTGMKSAFNGGHSEARDLQYDPTSLAGIRSGADYFKDLSKTGTDAISEADYAKKAALAEQSRKANTLAGLQQAEMRGQGNAGGALSVFSEGAQGAAGDRYAAGMQQAADAASRRDFAAGKGAELSHTAGADIAQSDQARAAAMDKYDQFKRAGLDDFAAKKASGLDQFATDVAAGKDAYTLDAGKAIDTWNDQRFKDFYGVAKDNTAIRQGVNDNNFNRTNTVNDANVDKQSQTNYANKVEFPQQKFQNDVVQHGGVSSALQGSAGDALQVGQTNHVGFKDLFTPITGALGNGAKALA